ncbi:MAG: thiamine biosynthesis protein ThiS [Candidatus Thermoplasmatota archaeon]
MRVTAKIKDVRREVTLPNGGDVAALLDALGLPLISYIVIRGSYPIPIDETLMDGDDLILLETFSGG